MYLDSYEFNRESFRIMPDPDFLLLLMTSRQATPIAVIGGVE